MLGDVLGELAESIEFGPGSKRGQTVMRVLFGLLGLFLSAVGGFQMLVVGIDGAGLHFNFAATLLFVSLGAFCLFNVTLLRTWRWPGRAFLLSFLFLFVVRIVLGP